MWMERVIALILAAPFVLLALAAWRFYRANPGVRERRHEDYVRESHRLTSKTPSHRSTSKWD